jgi:tetratricopeptide (TPR) repeat protein
MRPRCGRVPGVCDIPLHFRLREDRICRNLKVLDLDPNFVYARVCLGLSYERKRMRTEAIEQYERAHEISAGPVHLYARTGQHDRALRILDELPELSKRRYVATFFLARIHFGLGDRDRGFQAYEERDGYLVWLFAEPAFASLRYDPRYESLVRRMRFRGNDREG